MNKIHKNVHIGDNSKIGEFSVIGISPLGKKDGELLTKIGKNAIIRANAIIYAGNKIGDNFQTGHGVLVREKNEIGNNVSIGTLSVIEHHVKIEDNVRIHSQAFIPEFCILEKSSWIGPNVVLTNALYPASRLTKDNLEKVVVKKNAKLGANCTILPGIEIGENSLVGAGSVVTLDVPPNKVVVGNPARVVGNIKDLKYKGIAVY